MVKKRIFWVLLLLGSLVLLALPAGKWTKANVTTLQSFHNSKLSPIIMIPGSSATENRFDELIAKINETSLKKHSLLKVKVYNSGKMVFKGKIAAKDNEPFIVVGFENNHDGYSNILQQAKMFSKAFNKLTEDYNFNNFKGIGHSNGGLIYTAFLEKYYAKTNVSIKKLMTIGTPYNFNEASLQHKTQMLADFIKAKDKLPKDLSVYSIAGTENYDSDGLVPARSVEAGKYIYQGQVKSFTEITVTGQEAQHSDLPQNQQIIDLIERYILDKNQRPDPNGNR
ncbi:alpha/beta hydrolase [Ligilactobacillus sp. Marseille-Q7487]|uniref:alpha/beta hydrolase n=1 Tax=Ligilactobacillus sp. Marseille-Q7487 TaxID=3022128 RepID=UPI0024A85A3A|nr:alpha/beta hydrolase [Ligilactobacillus sp. Marseille-Q7487]